MPFVKVSKASDRHCRLITDAPTPTGPSGSLRDQRNAMGARRIVRGCCNRTYGPGLAVRFDRFDGMRCGTRWPGRTGEAADHEGDEGPGDVGLAVGDEPLVIPHVSPGLHDSRDGPLDTPPLGDDGPSPRILESDVVVSYRRLRCRPCRPAARISRATRRRPHPVPSRLSTAWMRGAP